MYLSWLSFCKLIKLCIFLNTKFELKELGHVRERECLIQTILFSTHVAYKNATLLLSRLKSIQGGQLVKINTKFHSNNTQEALKIQGYSPNCSAK